MSDQTVAETAESLLAFENAALPLCVVKPGGQLLMVNRALRELLGYDVDDLVGQPWESFLADDPEDVVGRSRAQVKAGSKVTPEQRIAARCSDGTSVWVRTSAVMVPDEQGDTRYIVARVVLEPDG